MAIFVHYFNIKLYCGIRFLFMWTLQWENPALTRFASIYILRHYLWFLHFISYPIANLFYSDSAYELYDEITFRENENQLKLYVSEILKGLVLLHSIGIIHNDMKPVSFCLASTSFLMTYVGDRFGRFSTPTSFNIKKYH